MAGIAMYLLESCEGILIGADFLRTVQGLGKHKSEKTATRSANGKPQSRQYFNRHDGWQNDVSMRAKVGDWAVRLLVDELAIE